MDKYEITKRIEKFAPLETQEEWDCSGWGIDVKDYNEIRRIMLCLTVTNDVIKQAKERNCDMIISHHPCFFVPLEWSFINIYCAHTNLDKAKGGTTDTLIANLKYPKTNQSPQTVISWQVDDNDFLRFITFDKAVSINYFSNVLKAISPNTRLINNDGIKEIKTAAFCAGSGSEFINEAKELKADCLVTGDLKFHTALESSIAVYDIGHFESEILVLPVFEKLIGNEAEFIYAREQSPFMNI